jgi:arylsulfatase A-like enzyme
MGTHRPYGTGADAIPGPLDRKAEAAGGRDWFDPFGDPVTDAERDRIVARYREALGRADDRIERLLDSIDAADPVVAITADHGDEFGEEGYFYHQGYRRRVADTLTRVPVALDGVDPVGEHCSLLDIAPTLAGAVGADPPDAWQGNDLRTTRTAEALTVAPWHDTATVAWQSFDPERKLVARDAAVTMTGRDGGSAVERADTSEAVREQLRDLGYTDAG